MLFPSMLFGLGLLLIPILIHLFHFRKAKKVYFTNTRFLSQAKKVTQSQNRLKHLLIMASRMLALAALVMAFTQPMLPAKEETLDSKMVYIYLDNSMSMTNKVQENSSALDMAVAYVDRILDMYPQGTKFQLLTNEFDAEARVNRSATQLSEKLTEVEYSPVERSLKDIFQRQRTEWTDNNAPSDFYWISDFQASTAGMLDEIAVDSLISLKLVPVAIPNVENIYIDSVYLNTPYYLPEQKNQLSINLRHAGQKDYNDLSVKMLINNTQIAATVVDLQAGEQQTVTFDVPAQHAASKVKVQIEEFPVTFDNERYLVLQPSPPVETVSIYEEQQNLAITRVFGNEDLFHFSAMKTTQLDFAILEKANFIFLDEVANLSPSLNDFLQQWVADGGHLVLIPSPKARPDAYVQLMPFVKVNKLDNIKKRPLQPLDLKNPFFANVFEKQQKNFQMFSAQAIVQKMNAPEVPLRFATGEPFLASKIYDNGKLTAFASPFNAKYSDFHLQALFVPVMYKLANESRRGSTNLYHSLRASSMELRGLEQYNQTLLKLRQGQEEVIPAQQWFGNKLVLELPRFALKTGFYDLINDQKKRISTLAFNFPAEESKLATIAPEELNSWAQGQGAEIISVENEQQLEARLDENYRGKALWMYFIALALLFLFFESLLIRFWK
ncbi:BatA domain-containing protein [Persicobacter psychrovividus]